jgi:hypothetical protein
MSGSNFMINGGSQLFTVIFFGLAVAMFITAAALFHCFKIITRLLEINQKNEDRAKLNEERQEATLKLVKQVADRQLQIMTELQQNYGVDGVKKINKDNESSSINGKVFSSDPDDNPIAAIDGFLNTR